MSFSAKEPLIIGLFCGKRPTKIRQPMGLCHSVARWLLSMSTRSSSVMPKSPARRTMPRMYCDLEMHPGTLHRNCVCFDVCSVSQIVKSKPTNIDSKPGTLHRNGVRVLRCVQCVTNRQNIHAKLLTLKQAYSTGIASVCFEGCSASQIVKLSTLKLDTNLAYCTGVASTCFNVCSVSQFVKT